MTALIIASAQTCSIAGDLAANIQRHLALMVAAAEHGVQLLVFAELSLTGYEPALAQELAIAPDDTVLAPLRELARELQMTVVVGMPIRLASSSGVLIGALVLSMASVVSKNLIPGIIIPVGIVTSLVGVPFFLSIILRHRGNV